MHTCIHAYIHTYIHRCFQNPGSALSHHLSTTTEMGHVRYVMYNMSACMHAWMHVCMYVCMYVCMHACMHVLTEYLYTLYDCLQVGTYRLPVQTRTYRKCANVRTSRPTCQWPNVYYHGATVGLLTGSWE
jgi:hypothetical protein